MKKILSLLLLALSTTAQRCDFLDSSIDSNYRIGNAKRQKQNLADIITTRDLGMVHTDPYSGRGPSSEDIKDILKKRYPTLNTDHIEVSVHKYLHSDPFVSISSNYLGNYTGSIKLTYTTKQKKKLSDIITIKDLGIIDIDTKSGIPSENEIKNILKRKYPTLNTDDIQVTLYDNLNDCIICINSSPSGNYTGHIYISCTIKQKQELSDIITIKALGIIKTDRNGFPLFEDIQDILKKRYPMLNLKGLECTIFPLLRKIIISPTNNSDYAGSVTLDYMTSKPKGFNYSRKNYKENNSDSYFDFGNSSSGKNNKGSTNSSSERRACNCDQAELNTAYKVLNGLLDNNKIKDLKKIDDKSSLNDLSKVVRKLCGIYHPNSTKEKQKPDNDTTKAITSSRTLIKKHFIKCQGKTDETPYQKSNNHQG
ncbi:hypothetical protein ACRRVC_03210 [Candidatus Cardinium hertigii]